jgi:single-stranded-DNA-specific exonuclease
MELELSDVTMKHYQTLREMAPFGVGNPKPVFAFKNALVKGVKQFGKTTEHLEVLFPGVRAISWYAKPDSFTEFVEVGKQVTLLAEFDYSVFRGKSELRLKIVDVLP